MRSDGTRGIFGHGTREAVLAAIHILGPATIADIARAVRTDADQAACAIAHFERHGLVRVSRNGANRSYATVDWRSPMYHETRALAARFADILGISGEPRFAHRWGVGRERRPVRGYASLFGSATATAALLHLAALGSDHVAAMARALSVEETVMADVAARLERDGLVRRLPRDGLRRPLVLDDGHPAAAEIRALLRAVLRVHREHKGRASVLRRRNRRAAAIPARVRARWTPLNAAARLVAVLHPRYARVLIVLAMRGPTTTGSLTRALGDYDPDGVRALARALVAAGLVRESTAKGKHVVECVFDLEPSHVAAPEMRRLALAAARVYGLGEALTMGAWRRGTVAGWPMDVGGRLAVLLAARAGSSDLMRVAAAAKWPRHLTRRRLVTVARDGAVRLAADDGILRVALDAAHPLADEVTTALDALLAAQSAPLRSAGL